MRIVQVFTENWQFVAAADEDFQAVTLPHTNKTFDRLSVDHTEYQFVSTYRRRFNLPDDVTGKCVYLDFDGVMLISTVYVNGKRIGMHKGGFAPFSFDITEAITPGENLLTVIVDSTEDPTVPPFGGQVDFLTFGGIYRDVSLRIVDPCHVVGVFPRTSDVLTAPRLDCDVQVSLCQPGMTLELRLEDVDAQVIASQSCEVTALTKTIPFSELAGVGLWSLNTPTLYTLRVTLLRDGAPVDEISVRFGFREAEFRADGRFYLNGEPLKLFGLNRHQSYPYIGMAAPRHLQEHDAELIKYMLSCNIVRTSHYPQSPHFLNRCDEIGLLVFEEMPGWHYLGDEAWKTIALDELRAMIERDRHHPSIILWGVRVNESPDDHEFYTQTNALAHQLDPTRQTGGVRDFISSEFLEDVFTLNDFPPGIQPPRVRPHLITEFGGHWFPTKSWDHEERRIEHALHHARKQDQVRGNPDVAGGIGWCAFDYATHPEFGSGDRICYHGVMDMFRLPKMAAYFYSSQKPPAEGIVLYAATHWTMGDRSGGGNNPLVIFSNCDEIDVFIGEAFQGRLKPDRAAYPQLEHPPFIMRAPEPYNPWGTPFHDLLVRGLIGGQVAAEQRIDSRHIPHTLRLMASQSVLTADGSDMARLAVQIVDRFDNVLPYQMRIVHLTMQGDAELVGSNPLVMLGGQGAVYIRAGHSTGKLTVTAECDGLPTAEIALELKPAFSMKW